ncbi:hypothetical protein M3194_01910 [Paenibacillus glycanilyticus]|uniref:golvesin C-terminal-like domain-containing protein n=1 Tax=Paenibacillus glycanilyticus TaxID=126569 RepID=UPI0020402801|nr:glycoside hydrolase [Paenibacillus glycanilyticus]MCM3626121.1 hypothetical protein [Paenibacillus glycanilyticus]
MTWKRRTGAKLLAAALAGSVVLTGAGEVHENRAYAAYTAVVDPSKSLNTWEGWGTSLAWWANRIGGESEAVRNMYADKLFSLDGDGLGLNIVRYNIGGGENPSLTNSMDLRAQMPGYKASATAAYDWTQDANQRNVLNDAISRINPSEFVAEAFSNSPPYWMNYNQSVAGGNNGAENLKADMYDDFADYLTTVVQHFRDTWGIHFHTLSAFNEPSAGYWIYPKNQEGNRVLPANQEKMISELYNSLASKGLNVGISGPEETSLDVTRDTVNSYSQATMDKLAQINTHAYAGSDRAGVFAAAEGKRLWNSETSDGEGSGFNMARGIVKDIKQMNISAYSYWQVVEKSVGDTNWGMLITDLNNKAGGDLSQYSTNKKYYAMAQFSRFIRPGYDMIDIRDDNSVAAYDSTGNKLVIVTVNDFGNSNDVTYDLSKFTNVTGTVTGYRTSRSGTQNLQPITGISLSNKSFTQTNPANSISTYVISGVSGFETTPENPDPSKQTLLTDSFDDGDAQGWTSASGSWSVANGSYLQSGNAASEAVSTTGDSAWTNYDVSADVKPQSAASFAATGVIGRYQDNNNYYYLRLHAGDNQLQLYKKASGMFTLLGSVPQAVSLNTAYSLKLSMIGSTIKGYLNDVEKISVTDTAVSAGKIGLRSYNQTAAIDNVLVSGVPVEIIVDNNDPGFEATGWTASTSDYGFYGSNYLHDGSANANPTMSATWRPSITEPGTYKIFMRYPSSNNRAAAAPLEIKYSGLLDNSKTINQTNLGGTWVEIGTYVFTSNPADNYIKISASANGYTVADAVKFIKQ